MRERLKPCPFCGGLAIALQVGEDIYSRQFQVICHWYEGETTGCGSASGYYDSLKDAVDAWNRRVTDDETESDPNTDE